MRILVLEPAIDSTASLRVSFEEDSIESLIGKYEAVSHVCGEPILTHPLYTNSMTIVNVTRNLNMALRRLRLNNEPRRLWADAVCINQADMGEKSKQIPLMVEIFQGASRVLA